MRGKKKQLLELMAKTALVLDQVPDDADYTFLIHIGPDYGPGGAFMCAEITLDDFSGSAVKALAERMGLTGVKEDPSEYTAGMFSCYFYPAVGVRISSFPYKKEGGAQA